jgi:hypothetical protein
MQGVEEMRAAVRAMDLARVRALSLTAALREWRMAMRRLWGGL